jgi:hypothetical protein
VIYRDTKEYEMPGIRVPQNIVIVDQNGAPVKDPNGNRAEVAFVRDFILTTLVNDPKFGKDLRALHASMDISDAFKTAKVGDKVMISHDLWSRLKDVVMEPSNAYNVVIMKQCKTFFNAVLEPEQS